MLTPCSQDQYTIYKGSFLTNLLCCWCDGVALSSLNQFTFTYLLSPPLPEVHWPVSSCHPFLSSSINLTDVMANAWLEVMNTGLPFHIPVGRVERWEYPFDTARLCEKRFLRLVKQWFQNEARTVFCRCLHTHTLVVNVHICQEST